MNPVVLWVQSCRRITAVVDVVEPRWLFSSGDGETTGGYPSSNKDSWREILPDFLTELAYRSITGRLTRIDLATGELPGAFVRVELKSGSLVKSRRVTALKIIVVAKCLVSTGVVFRIGMSLV